MSVGKFPTVGTAIGPVPARLPSKGICKSVDKDLSPRRRFLGSSSVSDIRELAPSTDIVVED